MERDITVSVDSEIKDKILGRTLKLKFEGGSVDNSVVNALRRTLLTEIPVYGFSGAFITIEKNTSVFNNDYMRHRLTMLPIPSSLAKSEITHLNKSFYPYVRGVYDPTHPEKPHPKDPEDTKDIRVYINAVNTGDTVKLVTTDDIKFVVDGEEQKNPYDSEYPCLIIKLRKGEEFKAMAVANLGISKLHESWAAVANSIILQKQANEYLLVIYSLGYKRQLTEYEVVLRACDILLLKLEYLKESVKASDDDSKQNFITIPNESHTLGNLLSTTLRRIAPFAAYKKGHPQVEEITLGIVANDSVMKSMNTVVDYLIDLFGNIKSQVEKIGDVKKDSKKDSGKKKKSK